MIYFENNIKKIGDIKDIAYFCRINEKPEENSNN